MERRQGGIPFGGAVSQTGYFSPHPPALKGGVTANVALQAGRGFATAPSFFAFVRLYSLIQTVILPGVWFAQRLIEEHIYADCCLISNLM